MDVFSHALWTNLLYYSSYKQRVKDRLLAVFFGVAPDLVSFTPTTLYLLFHRISFPRTVDQFPDLAIFKYAVYSYNFTHSLVIFSAFFLIVLVFRRGKIYWPIFGWLFHIVLDIFTHKAEFFATPILFPISNSKYLHEFSWADPKFLVINWLVLLLLYGLIIADYYRSKRVKLVTLKDAIK